MRQTGISADGDGQQDPDHISGECQQDRDNNNNKVRAVL